MYNGGNIILKKAGQIMPKQYLQQAFAKATVFGAMLVDGGQLAVIQSENKESFSLGGVLELLDSYKDRDVFMYVGEWDKGYLKDSMQPFTLLDKNGDPIVAAMLVGSFPGCAQVKSSHSSSFLAVNTYLSPKITGLWKNCDGKVDDLFDRMNTQLGQVELNALCIPHGHIVLLSNTGRVLSFHDKEAPATETPFGYCLNSYGYVHETDKPKAKEAEVKKPSSLTDKVRGMLLRGSGPIADGNVEAKPAEAPKPEAPAEEPKTETEQQPDEREYTEKEITVPSGLKDKNARKRFFNQQLGFTPEGYLKLDKFTVRQYLDDKSTVYYMAGDKGRKLSTRASTTYKSFQEASEALGQAVKGDTSHLAHDVGRKDVAPHHIGTAPDTLTGPAKPIEKPSAEIPQGYTSVLSDADKIAIKKEYLDGGPVKKSMDQHGQMIANPAEYKTALGKIKPLHEELGIKLEDTFPWSQEALLHLGKVNLEALALLCMNYRNGMGAFQAWVNTLKPPAKEAAPAEQKREPQTLQRLERKRPNMAA